MDNGIIKRRRSYDYLGEEITAEDVIEAIEELSNEEHVKLIDYLKSKYFKH